MLVLVALSGPATGQMRPVALATEGPTRTFEDFDTNGDGVIERREAQPWPALRDRLPAFDENGDDRLDRSEFSALESYETYLRERSDTGQSPRLTPEDAPSEGALEPPAAPADPRLQPPSAPPDRSLTPPDAR